MGIQIPKIKTDGEVFDFAECLMPWEFVHFQCTDPYESIYSNVVLASNGRMKPVQEAPALIEDSRQEIETFKDGLENLVLREFALLDIRSGVEHAARVIFPRYRLASSIPPRVYCVLMTDLAAIFKIAAKAKVASELAFAIRPWQHYWEHIT